MRNILLGALVCTLATPVFAQVEGPYLRTMSRVQIVSILDRAIGRFNVLVASEEGSKYGKLCNHFLDRELSPWCRTSDADQIHTALVGAGLCTEYRATLASFPGEKPWDNVSDADFQSGMRIVHDCAKHSGLQ